MRRDFSLLELDPWRYETDAKGNRYHIHQGSPMPRIPDEILKCSVYLYSTEERANFGAPVDGGSGFLLSYPTGRMDLRPRPHIYVVTCRHVIHGEPAHMASDGKEHPGAKVVRFNAVDGTNPIVSLGDGWHSAINDDLAIRLLDADKRPSPVRAFRFIPAHLLVTEDLVTNLSLGIGNEVFMVGRLIRQEQEAVNCPIVRFGHISCPLLPPQIDSFGEDIFLAEYRSLGKASGSPVFLEISDRQRAFYKDQLEGNEHLLLGVNKGNTGYRSPAEEVSIQISKAPSAFSVHIDSSMSMVVPAWRLRALLEKEDVRKQRQAIEDAIPLPPVCPPSIV